MTPRSLVGMTMSARKRRARAVTYCVVMHVTFIAHAEEEAEPRHCALFHARKMPRHHDDLAWYRGVRVEYRIGDRLRPCRGNHCYNGRCLRCNGSGVERAARHKVRK